MKRTHSLIGLITIAATLLAASRADAVQLPHSWFRLPEQDGASTSNALSTESIGTEVERLLQAHQDVLESRTASSELDYEENRWHAEFFAAGLGVAGSGTLGILGAKGSPSVQLYWRRKQATPAPSNDENEEQPEPSVLAFRGGESREQLAAQLEPFVAALLESGKVKNGSTLRGSLISVAEQFRDLADAIPSGAPTSWKLAKLRVDVGVSATGTVALTTNGGAVRLRFEWTPSPKPAATTVETEGQRSLRELASALLEDLDAASDEGMRSASWFADEMRIGLGMAASGTIGVAKAGSSVIGHLSFKRMKPETVKPGSIATIEEIPMILDSDQGDMARFARANGIRGKDQVYRVDRAKFRKGLRKSLQMGEFFAKHAARVKSGTHWTLYKIKTEFEFSLSGTVGLVTLDGLVTSELVFKYTQFSTERRF